MLTKKDRGQITDGLVAGGQDRLCGLCWRVRLVPGQKS